MWDGAVHDCHLHGQAGNPSGTPLSSAQTWQGSPRGAGHPSVAPQQAQQWSQREEEQMTQPYQSYQEGAGGEQFSQGPSKTCKSPVGAAGNPVQRPSGAWQGTQGQTANGQVGNPSHGTGQAWQGSQQGAGQFLHQPPQAGQGSQHGVGQMSQSPVEIAGDALQHPAHAPAAWQGSPGQAAGGLQALPTMPQQHLRSQTHSPGKQGNICDNMQVALARQKL